MSGEFFLKPCPFCGGEAEIERIWTRSASSQVACTDCGARKESTSTGLNSNREWNERPIEDKLKKDNSELASRVTELEDMAEDLVTLLRRIVRSTNALNKAEEYLKEKKLLGGNIKRDNG